jgi:hypothetical protein
MLNHSASDTMLLHDGTRPISCWLVPFTSKKSYLISCAPAAIHEMQSGPSCSSPNLSGTWLKSSSSFCTRSTPQASIYRLHLGPESIESFGSTKSCLMKSIGCRSFSTLSTRGRGLRNRGRQTWGSRCRQWAQSFRSITPKHPPLLFIATR